MRQLGQLEMRQSRSPLDALVNANVGSKDDDLQPGRDHERSESPCPL